jgi:HSP20 family protein
MMMERWRPRGLPFLPSVWGRFPVEEMGWAPAIEVLEKKDKFVVRAELPGMKEEDIDVSVIGDTLTITGERKAETEVQEENYYCCERSYGSFLRSIAIPSHVNVDKIKATYEDGLLEISLPKAPEVKPKKVSVSARKQKAASVAKRARGKKKEKTSK